MNIRQMLFSTFAMSVVATLISCSENDEMQVGKWEPMRWKTEVKTIKDAEGGYVNVPKEGGTYAFTSLNYGKSFWLSQAEEVLKGEIKPYYVGQNGTPNREDWYSLQTLWADIYRKGTDLVVTLRPNEGSSERTLKVAVTAGDVFGYFRFVQSAGK